MTAGEITVHKTSDVTIATERIQKKRKYLYYIGAFLRLRQAETDRFILMVLHSQNMNKINTANFDR